MLLLYKALFSLSIAVPSWFGLLSSGHEIQVRIPVWNVGNIFSNLAKGHPTTTRRPTKPPTRSTKPPTKPTHPNDDICVIYPHLPACQEEVTPEPSICDTYPHLPECQEEPSICDTHPELTECQEEPSICDTHPELPECQEEPSICDTNPELPECQNPEPSICDTYPELPECQNPGGRNSQVSDVALLLRNTDPSFCLYYPNSCSNAEESPLVPLVDSQGRSLLLILPGARGKKVPASGRSSTGWLRPTRRPAWQSQSKKDTLQRNQDK